MTRWKKLLSWVKKRAKRTKEVTKSASPSSKMPNAALDVSHDYPDVCTKENIYMKSA